VFVVEVVDVENVDFVNELGLTQDAQVSARAVVELKALTVASAAIASVLASVLACESAVMNVTALDHDSVAVPGRMLYESVRGVGPAPTLCFSVAF
jgi:hypothetical protein